MKLALRLFAVAQGLKLAARFQPTFRERIKQKNMTVQLKLQDNSVGRYIEFRNGRIYSKGKIHPNPDVVVFFKTIDVAEKMLSPKQDYLFNIDAMKNFKMGMTGPEDLSSWLMETVSLARSVWWKYGENVGGGLTRYTGNSNGGPMHVYVKDGKIVRITPIELTEDDAPSWTIKARGMTFKPARQTTLAPYSVSSKSLIYSKDRLMYPLKRVDFDPNGERNPQNRGISGYERISWDEALDIVGSEIKRIKKKHGSSAIVLNHSAHQNWGNIGYLLSSTFRFFNLVGFTKINGNPSSWEGWYWGAVHHWGHTMRLGMGEQFGQVEDCLQNCEMIVFWSSDPEATNGVYAAYEGTERRMWAQKLGIKFVHIDPYLNETAALFGGKWIAPRPGTDPALAQAICHVWITENLYDKNFVETRTTGFDEWAAYILGQTDGTAKTPEWAEQETGVPARDIRSLARDWGKKKTYLGAGAVGNGLGGACRTATGAQWARMMVIMMAMQGIGRPGVNFGNMQVGTPLDFSFWFPGYADGGISGDLQNTAAAPNTYQRIPNILTMNNVKQMIPRLWLPEAVMEGQATGYPNDVMGINNQFVPFRYPTPGYSAVKMLYKFGSSQFGTMTNTNRWVKMYQDESIEFVANQSIWNEGEVRFADIVLPACTNFERWDIGEWANSGGYLAHCQTQLNHRVITLQHKCIEPVGESKSDYQIYLDLAKRLGMSALYSEGMTELDWCKRIFDGSDISSHISWSKFLRKGYYVVPAEKPALRAPVSYRWFYEGRKKDVPEPHPLPADYSGEWLDGLQTQSGKFEFIPESLKKIDDPDRPPLNRYIPSWEGTSSKDILEKYPIQLLSVHPRYSFHTQADGKDATTNDIKGHRILVNGHYYLTCRINARDAAKRNIRNNDLIRIYNDRGAVICAAVITARIREGVAHTYESSAVYDPIGRPGESADRGGCVNLLTPSRSQIQGGHSMGPNACLIQIERWPGSVAAKSQQMAEAPAK